MTTAPQLDLAAVKAHRHTKGVEIHRRVRELAAYFRRALGSEAPTAHPLELDGRSCSATAA
jgi:hypothetical protein